MKEKVKKIIRQYFEEGRKLLLEPEAEQVLSLYGVPVLPAKVAKEADEAVTIAKELGFPVVLKVISAQIIHKSDAGGVKVGLNTGEDVVNAFNEIMKNARNYDPKAKIDGLFVQKMSSPGGREVIIGATKDPQFGPVVMFGLGGIFVEVLKDVVFRVAPISPPEAMEMIQEIKGLPILKGTRGEKPINFDSLSKAISNISQLVFDFPEIVELDANPVYVYEDGLYAVDARIVLSRV